MFISCGMLSRKLGLSEIIITTIICLVSFNIMENYSCNAVRSRDVDSDSWTMEFATYSIYRRLVYGIKYNKAATVLIIAHNFPIERMGVAKMLKERGILNENTELSKEDAELSWI